MKQKATAQYIVVTFENYGCLVYDTKLNEVICKCPFNVHAHDIAKSMNESLARRAR